MLFLYGVVDNYKDVTSIVMEKFYSDGCVNIPATDNERSYYFGDHVNPPNRPISQLVESSNTSNSLVKKTIKHIKMVDANDEYLYLHGMPIQLDISYSFENTNKNRQQNWMHSGKYINDPVEKLAWIHRHLNFAHGELKNEYPEQLMTVRFLEETATVLELGANIGRNTCVIATILNDDSRLVSLETDARTTKLLRHNRDINNFKFHIENSALSKIPLCQEAWNTIPFTGKLPSTDYFMVKTISFNEIQQKYGLIFDTLVADCEGALYQILQDDPAMLKNIKMIIIENDYFDENRKSFVDSIFQQYGLKPIYTEGRKSTKPSSHEFYQVWKR